MSKGEEEIKACELCGASIYPEHVKKHAADLWMGKLLCKHCLDEKRQIAAVNPAAALADSNRGPEPELAPILLDELEPPTSPNVAAPPGARAAGPAAGPAPPAVGPLREGRYRRPLQPDSPGATRCRTFHCKLNDPSIAHMGELINEWVDADDNIRIKFAATCIGMVEGKSTSDPNLFVTVFY